MFLRVKKCQNSFWGLFANYVLNRKYSKHRRGAKNFCTIKTKFSLNFTENFPKYDDVSWEWINRPKAPSPHTNTLKAWSTHASTFHSMTQFHVKMELSVFYSLFSFFSFGFGVFCLWVTSDGISWKKLDEMRKKCQTEERNFLEGSLLCRVIFLSTGLTSDVVLQFNANFPKRIFSFTTSFTLTHCSIAAKWSLNRHSIHL